MNKLVRLSDLFEIEYGNQLDKNKLTSAEDGYNFVSRSSKNLGVDGKVTPIDGIKPYSDGLITVTLGGTYLLSSFVQPSKFYTGQNIKVLNPIEKMSFNEKVFYCNAIASNRFRYTSHGREANKTVNRMLVPSRENIPNWVNGTSSMEPDKIPMIPLISPLDISKWGRFKYEDLFEIKKGKRLIKSRMKSGNTPFVGAIEFNNGWRQFVDSSPIHQGNTISVNYNGSVAEAFYQPKSFWASDDVNILYPKFKMTPHIAIFLVTIIKSEKFRFNYGRKWHLGRMNESIMYLPSTQLGKPDWEYIENYIKSLPYSRSI